MINKVILVGNVGRDPERTDFDNGGSVANFSLATSENLKGNNGERQSRTEWHNVVVFGKLVDTVQKYVKKGDKLYLEGKIRTEIYDKDGEKRYSTKVYVNSLRMLGGGNKQVEQAEQSVEQGDGDLPF